jgi:hypothetical protein
MLCEEQAEHLKKVAAKLGAQQPDAAARCLRLVALLEKTEKDIRTVQVGAQRQQVVCRQLDSFQLRVVRCQSTKPLLLRPPGAKRGQRQGAARPVPSA